VTLMIGGAMALDGAINAQELTSYVMYVEFVTAASLSVCDQWGPFMEALGASERVIGYLDLAPAPQIASGVTLPTWSGRVRCISPLIRQAKDPGQC
jgi:ABC-type multidrug transport system fused ATPase/permease subunit